MAIIPYLCPFGLSKKSYHLKCNAPTMRYVKKVSGKANALHQKKKFIHSLYTTQRNKNTGYFSASLWRIGY